MIFKDVKKALILIIIWYPTLYLFRIGSLDIPSILVFFVALCSLNKVFTKKELKRFPFKMSLLFCALSYLLSNYFTEDIPHNGALLHFLTLYLLIYLEWCIYKGDDKTNHLFLKQLSIYLFILVIVGYFETFTGVNIFIKMLNNSGMLDILPPEDNIRYGVRKAQSLTIWSEVYGMICGMGIITLLVSVSSNMKKQSPQICFSLVLLFIAVVFCGSRAVLVGVLICCLTGVTFFFKNAKRVIALILVGAFLVFLSSNFIDQVIIGLIHPDKVGGSNWEMREMQMATSIYYFFQHPILGNGLFYVYNIIMELDKASINGAEGLLFEVLIDRGLLGVLSLILLVLQVGKFLFRNNAGNLSLVMFGFLFAKMMTLMASLEEMFFIFYIIPFYHIQNNAKKVSCSIKLRK